MLQQRSYLEKVLGALLQVLGKHGRVEGLAFMLQQPALVPGLVCGQLLIVQPPVTLSHTHTHSVNASVDDLDQNVPAAAFTAL